MATPTSSSFLRRLLSEGHLREEQLQDARALRSGSKQSLVQCVVKLGHLPEEQLVAMLARHAGCPVVDVERVAPDQDLLARLPYRVAQSRGVLPLRIEDGQAVVAMSDPTDVIARDELVSILRAPVKPVVAAPSALERAITNAYRPEEAAVCELIERYAESTTATPIEVIAAEEDLGGRSGMTYVGAGVGAGLGGLGGPALAAAGAPGALSGAGEPTDVVAETSPIAELVGVILRDAVRQRASDVHLEPHEQELLVRYRVDGILREVQRLPRTVRSQVTSRIKIVARMDIATTRKPQDARAMMLYDGRRIDLRVSTLPALHGEKVVIRLLDPTNLILDLKGVFPAEEAQLVESLLRRPQGLLLITGPTGSGKTTTLYSAVSRLRDKSRSIVTIEDPVEYKLEGLNQVEVHERAGFDFSSALRALLRQDPNVILVGEIRDEETAKVALQAAITGHLILSTMHTTDAASAISRLANLGVDPSLVAEGVTGVVAQRLVRRLCSHCREPYRATGPEVERASPTLEGASVFKPRGCDRCDYVGYRGRVAASEVLALTPELRDLIVTRRPENEIRKAARASGVDSIFDSAMKLVLSGTTTLEEVGRAIPRDLVESTLRCGSCGEGLERDFRVCPGCGTALTAVCSKCRREMRSTWRFCPGCGKASGRKERAAPATTPAGAAAPPGPVPEPVADAALAAPVPAAAAGVARAPAAAVSATAATPPGGVEAAADRKLEVLVVDDAQDTRMIVDAVLKRAGYGVSQASGGEEALRKIAARLPDAVILDYSMPDLDGIQVCKRLRGRLETASLPIILLTGRTEDGVASEAYEAGADDYLTKPVVPAMLVKRLGLVLEHKAKYERTTAVSAPALGSRP